MPHNDPPPCELPWIEPVLPGDSDHLRFECVPKPDGGALLYVDGELVGDTDCAEDWLTLEEAAEEWDSELGGATDGFSVFSDADGGL